LHIKNATLEAERRKKWSLKQVQEDKTNQKTAGCNLSLDGIHLSRRGRALFGSRLAISPNFLCDRCSTYIFSLPVVYF